MKSLQAALTVGVFALAQPSPLAADGGLPPEIRELRIVQKIGGHVPLDVLFQNSNRRSVTLGECFNNRPVILVLAYYRCPRLCSRVLNELVKSMRGMSLMLSDDYCVVTISFDPRETPSLAAANKAGYLSAYGRATDGWYFLTGRERDIRRVANSVGFRYIWDEKRRQYRHSTAIIVLTPTGKVSRYYFGLSYAPNDLENGLQQAREERVGAPVNQALLLTCFSFNPSTGKNTFAVYKLLRTLAVLTVLGIVGYLLWNGRGARQMETQTNIAGREE